MTRTKFNSFLDPEWIKPEDQSKKTISGDELGYNERGQVVIVKKPDINLYEITQSYAEEQTLAAQLKRIEQGLQKPLPEQRLDVTGINPDTINEDRIKQQAELLAKQKELEKAGLDTTRILKADDQEIASIVAEYVKKELEKQKGVKEDVKQ